MLQGIVVRGIIVAPRFSARIDFSLVKFGRFRIAFSGEHVLFPIILCCVHRAIEDYGMAW